jgi:hypothetical protein
VEAVATNAQLEHTAPLGNACAPLVRIAMAPVSMSTVVTVIVELAAINAQLEHTAPLGNASAPLGRIATAFVVNHTKNV